MLKLSTGFLLGVISTLAVVLLLYRQPAEVPKSASSPTSKSGEVAAAQRSSSAQRADQVAEEDSEDPHPPVSVESNSNVYPLASDAQSVVASRQDVQSADPAQDSSARIAKSEYPPEIAEMIENRVDKELQARYENDSREDSWASYMEGLLAAYFAQKPQLAQFYISLIDCRTSICEIHLLGYGPEALTQWNSATADMVSQPWFEFNNMSMNRRNPEPGILAIVLILTKKPPD